MPNSRSPDKRSLSFSVPPDLLARLKKIMAARSVTLTTLIVGILEYQLNKEAKNHEEVKKSG